MNFEKEQFEASRGASLCRPDLAGPPGPSTCTNCNYRREVRARSCAGRARLARSVPLPTGPHYARIRRKEPIKTAAGNYCVPRRLQGPIVFSLGLSQGTAFARDSLSRTHQGGKSAHWPPANFTSCEKPGDRSGASAAEGKLVQFIRLCTRARNYFANAEGRNRQRRTAT